MLLDVPICTCIKIQLSGVIMIGSITLKCRFGEKLWSNWRCISPPFEEVRSFFLVLPVYLNRPMKAMLVSSIINIFDGKFLLRQTYLPRLFCQLFLPAGRVHCDVPVSYTHLTLPTILRV